MAQVDVDTVIVGAGFAGAATAYHLAKLGSASVLLLEKEAQPGVHSSGRNAAIVREHVEDPAMQPLMTAGAAILRRGHLATFEQRGLMLLGLGEQDVRPHFPRAVGTGLWCPQDGTVDIAGLLRSYLSDRRVSFSTTVLGWQNVDKALRVQTSEGTIVCNLLVNAAGPWAGTLGGLPLTPMNRHLFVTGPVDWVKPNLPCVWDGDLGLYFRPEADGLLLCCGDEKTASPGQYDEDPAILEQLAQKLASSQPGLGDLSIRQQWVGQRVFAPDRRFVIGFDPRCQRVFHVAALGGHGVTASYAVGRLAASLITGHAVVDAKTLNSARHVNPAPLAGPATQFGPARLLLDTLVTS